MFEAIEFHRLSEEFLAEITTALLCGVILGIERELRGKPVGLRTSMLIVLGTTVFVRAGILVAETSPEAGDPSRVLGQVATGIGFIGAGVMFNQGHTVRGVTTAATVWVLAAIGSMIGAGFFLSAVAVSVIAFIILAMLDYVEVLLVRLQVRLTGKRPEERNSEDSGDSSENSTSA